MAITADGRHAYVVGEDDAIVVFLFSEPSDRWDQIQVLYDGQDGVDGIALGYAVIPIIFSISEDALSSVPPTLTSAAR